MLTRDEAIRRGSLLDVTGYRLDLDLTMGSDAFGVATTITFACREPGASTFAEHRARSITSIRLNDGDLIPAEVWAEGRIALENLQPVNELVVVSEGTYSPTADGLCRSVDPADGETYVFSMCFLDAAPQVFACFDQPDLKAPFTIGVAAPHGWTVLSNGAGTEAEPGVWRFDPTLPLPTYLVAVAAGPWHQVHDRGADPPMTLACRRSAAPFLDADALFEITRQGVEVFEDLFATAYPYTKYDQVFVPFFGRGAMENAACTTLGEDLLLRAATDAERSVRSEVILHELAHMWFGDLVSIPWWDDLWLNESFATYMAYLALDRAVGDPSAWARFTLANAEGSPHDQMPTTHPIVDRIATTGDALMNFDRISYEKGASVIRQLIAWIGEGAFRAGIARYIAAHAQGTASLADLLEALVRDSGRDLGTWAAAWLHQAGIDTLRVELRSRSDETVVSVRTIAPASPPSPNPRPHAISLAAYDLREGRAISRQRLPVEIDGRAVDRGLRGGPPSFVLVDDEALTWAKRRLDPDSLGSVLDVGVSVIADPLARTVMWLTLRDMTLDAELPVGTYLDAALDGIGRETDPAILEALVAHTAHTIERLGDPALRGERDRLLAERCLDLLSAAPPGSDRQLLLARAAVRAAVAPSQLDRLDVWRLGRELPSGLTFAAEDGWRIVARLAMFGRLDAGAIEKERERDPTTSGREHAAAASASLPSPVMKQRAWDAIFDPQIPSSERAAGARVFWRSDDDDLVLPFVDALMPAVLRAWGTERLPTIAGVVRELLAEVPSLDVVVEMIAAAATSSEPDPPLRRVLVECRWELDRARATRALDRQTVS